jgi:hypothetical protein
MSDQQVFNWESGDIIDYSKKLNNGQSLFLTIVGLKLILKILEFLPQPGHFRFQCGDLIFQGGRRSLFLRAEGVAWPAPLPSVPHMLPRINLKGLFR